MEKPKVDERTPRELLAYMVELLEPINEISMQLITQADIQAYTEKLYNQLVMLAYDGISFLKSVEEGQTISPEWVAQRDDLIARAQKMILDAPNASQSQP